MKPVRPAEMVPHALLTEEEVVIELAGRVGRHGEQQRVAKQLGVSQGNVSNVLTNGRGVGPRLAAALGYRKVTRFERVK